MPSYAFIQFWTVVLFSSFNHYFSKSKIYRSSHKFFSSKQKIMTSSFKENNIKNKWNYLIHFGKNDKLIKEHTVYQSHVCDSSTAFITVCISGDKSPHLWSAVSNTLHWPQTWCMYWLWHRQYLFFFLLQLYHVGHCQMLNYQVNNFTFNRNPSEKRSTW